MFFQWRILFLVLILVGFNSCSPVLAATANADKKAEHADVPEGTLFRSTDNGARVLYADSLMVGDYEYDLNYPIDRTLAEEAWNYSTIDATNAKSGTFDDKKRCSHVLANGFDIYKDTDSNVVCEYEQFATTEGIAIDWMSHNSTCKVGDTESSGTGKRAGCSIHHKKSNVGNGHSEPQLVEDILKTKPESLVKLFTPRSSNKQVKQVMMSGLELYGTFDMCDSCLDALVAFRKKEGQQSIAKAIEDNLKRRKIPCPVGHESFVLIYHAYDRYDDSRFCKYYTHYSGQRHEFECRYGQCEDDDPYVPIFIPKGNSGNTLKDKVLSQAKSIPIRENMVYGHIHLLSGQQARYKEPDLVLSQSAFFFDGK